MFVLTHKKISKASQLPKKQYLDVDGCEDDGDCERGQICKYVNFYDDEG